MVILDIGDGVGALVVTVPEELCGRELEISPRGQPRARSHTVARRRLVPAGPLVAAVFPAVTAGDHDLWAPDGSWLGTARVSAGHVTEVDYGTGAPAGAADRDAGRPTG
jgi:hypothetical protein